MGMATHEEKLQLFSSSALQEDVRNSTSCKTAPVQQFEGMLAASAFAKLKLKVTARDFKNSALKLNILAFTQSLNVLTT